MFYDYVENLTKAYRTAVLEEEEAGEALKAIDEFRGFLKQKIKARYGSSISRLKDEEE